MSYEKISHPTHYNIVGRKECIEEMLERYGVIVTGIFCLTNAYKYLYRAGIKEGETQDEDIKKAKWYFDWLNSEKRVKKLNTSSLGSELFDDVSSLYLNIKESLKQYEE